MLSGTSQLGPKMILHRIHDVIHTNKKLILVFEYVDTDLKKFMNQFEKGLDLKIVKVCKFIEGFH